MVVKTLISFILLHQAYAYLQRKLIFDQIKLQKVRFSLFYYCHADDINGKIFMQMIQ